jgi:hypothetical protein
MRKLYREHLSSGTPNDPLTLAARNEDGGMSDEDLASLIDDILYLSAKD